MSQKTRLMELAAVSLVSIVVAVGASHWLSSGTRSNLAADDGQQMHRRPAPLTLGALALARSPKQHVRDAIDAGPGPPRATAAPPEDRRFRPDDPQILAAQRRWLEERAVLLEDRLQSEPVDVAWQGEIRHLLHNAEAEGVFGDGTRVLEVACAATMCLLEAEHDTESARRRFPSAIPTAVGTALQHMHAVVDEADEMQLRSRVFMARSGHDLPRPPRTAPDEILALPVPRGTP